MSTSNSDVYAADSASDSTADAVRRAHLHQEALTHALGVVFSLIGAVVLLATIFALVTKSNAGLEIRPGILGAVDLTTYTLGIVATTSAGWGLRRLRPWARIEAIALCCIFVLRIPDGTLIFPYFLYLLLSKKGKRLFAADYAAILAATRHIKYSRWTVLWTVLAVVLFDAALIALRIAIRGSAH